MTYQIPLLNSEAVSAVRLRAETKGPLCDNLPGLIFKLFLVDPVNPCYATFYLWKNPAGPVSFLKGPLFAALVKTFGRPEVRLSLPVSLGSRDFPGELWEVVHGESFSAPAEALCTYYNPNRDEDISLTPTHTAGRGRRFEVIYRARGAEWSPA